MWQKKFIPCSALANNHGDVGGSWLAAIDLGYQAAQ